MLDKLKDWLLGLMESALEGFDEMVEGAATILSGEIGGWTDALSLSRVLRPFCYTIIGICLLIELANVAVKVDLVKWEHGLKIGVKAVLAKVCIDVAPAFLKACYVQAQSWIVSLTPRIITGSSLGQTTMSNLEPLVESVDGFGNILGLFLSTFIIMLAIKICGLVIQVIAYGRIFELLIYVVISPLPCAFFPMGGGDGGDINRITSKFFKSFIAVCLQGVMMLIAIGVFNMVLGSAITTTLSNIGIAGLNASVAITDLSYTMLLGAIALVMAVAKSGSWAKSIIDAM